VAAAGTSVAIFAPGWTCENGPGKGLDGHQAQACDAEFWEGLAVDRIRESQ
jgi:hypothetical protein